MNMIKATCVIPFNMVFKTGLVTIQITQDGRNYAWYRAIYMSLVLRFMFCLKLIEISFHIICSAALPSMGTPGMMDLVTTVHDTDAWQHDWNRNDVHNLTIKWSSANISTLPNARIDINVWGYYEDVLDRDLVKVHIKFPSSPTL